MEATYIIYVPASVPPPPISHTDIALDYMNCFTMTLAASVASPPYNFILEGDSIASLFISRPGINGVHPTTLQVQLLVPSQNWTLHHSLQSAAWRQGKCIG